MTSALASLLRAALKGVLPNRQGNVAILTAVAMPVLVAFVGMVGEYGYGLMLKSEDQRAADLAAYSGALAYSSTATTSALQSAANSAAALNGLSASQLTASLVSSPSGDGNPAVLVTVSTVQPLLLTQLVSRTPSFTVKASAYAEIKGAAACILALNQSGTGVTLSGGTAVSAPSCAVASNSTVTVPCGDTVTTTNVGYDLASAPSQPCGGIVAPSGGSVSISKGYTNNPLASNAAVLAAASSLSTVSSLKSPTVSPVPSGLSVDFAWSQPIDLPQGCSGSLNTSTDTWTVTCSGYASYNFGSVTLGGGLNLVVNATGSTPSSLPTFNFSGPIQNNGKSMTFGSGTFNMAQGIDTGGSTVTTFGAGTFNIGPMTTSCNGGGTYSICNTGGAILTFGGPSAFNISAGVYNSSKLLTLGSGSTNSFDIGASSNGNALYTGGGDTTVLADATGSSDVFDLVGNIVTLGGSSLTLSAAAQHDIDGSLNAEGGVNLGSGVYVVSGYVALGASSGGGVVDGNGVSFVLGGSTTVTCNNAAQVFCVGAGYSNVTLTAPTSGPNAGFLVIGPTSASNTAGAAFTAGATDNSLSGVFYMPNGAVSLSGGASVGNGTGQCLELIGSQISLSGGTALASTCAGVGQTAVATVELVQ